MVHDAGSALGRLCPAWVRTGEFLPITVQLQDWLRESLPGEADPTSVYLGRPRLIVATPRPHALAG